MLKAKLPKCPSSVRCVHEVRPVTAATDSVPAAAHVTNEVVRLSPNPSTNQTAQARSSIGPLVTEELLSEVARIYPEPIVNASRDTNTYKGRFRCSAPLTEHGLTDTVTVIKTPFSAPSVCPTTSLPMAAPGWSLVRTLRRVCRATCSASTLRACISVFQACQMLLQLTS